MIFVGILDTEGVSRFEKELLENIPGDVVSRIKNTHSERERALKIGAYSLLSRLYKIKRSGAELPQILYTDAGKPYFAGSENENNYLHFSISHDKNVAVVAIGDTPVGVDVQSMPKRRISLEGIAKRFFASQTLSPTPEISSAIEPEAEYFYFGIKDGEFCELEASDFSPREISLDEARGDFLARWTLLEANLKMTGTGFSGDGLRKKETENKTKTVFITRKNELFALTVCI